MKRIAVIGGGWYGCHIARFLKLQGYEVTIFESSDDIFKGISGKFGIRLHTGLHYPRSPTTRKSCREGYKEFIKTYPELVIEHAYSIYGLGTVDANNEPPKVNLTTFKEIRKENKNSREIDPSKWGYSNLQGALDIEEPSILVGNLLREKFKTYLLNAGVKIVCNFKVDKLIRKGIKTFVMGNSFCEGFDYAVNTTSYQALLPPPEPALPFELDIIYQPCLALIYEDKLSKLLSLPPFSFIVIDGWFPCIMPYITNPEAENTYRKYIVTHGKYTIMGSYKTMEEASTCLAKIDEKFVTTYIQPKCEAEMKKFWPLFGACMPDSSEPRFKYVDWKGTILAKIKTNREFRSAITFEREGIVYVIPGKVSNIFDAGRETLSLINNQNVLRRGVYQYVKHGVLHDAVVEITESIDPNIKNTCALQTYAELTSGFDREEKITPLKSMQNSFLKPTPTQWLKSKSVDHHLSNRNFLSFFKSPPKLPEDKVVPLFPMTSTQEADSIIKTRDSKINMRHSL